jgi:hypothetical protein
VAAGGVEEQSMLLTALAVGTTCACCAGADSATAVESSPASVCVLVYVSPSSGSPSSLLAPVMVTCTAGSHFRTQ